MIRQSAKTVKGSSRDCERQERHELSIWENRTERYSRNRSTALGWGAGGGLKRSGFGRRKRLMRSPRNALVGDNSVLDLLNSTTDNEIAVIGCLAAMVGSLGLMFLSGTVFARADSTGQGSRQAGRVHGQVSQTVGPRSTDQEAA